MPRAMLLAICLTSRYRRPPGPSCAGSGSSSRFARKSLRSRCAACIFLMQVCALLAGCGAKPVPAPAPVIVAVQPCARPAKPSLPALRGVFLESRQGYTLLKARDARIRAYIAGLEDALTCYEAQTIAADAAREGSEPRRVSAAETALSASESECHTGCVAERHMKEDAVECYERQIPEKNSESRTD